MGAFVNLKPGFSVKLPSISFDDLSSLVSGSNLAIVAGISVICRLQGAAIARRSEKLGEVDTTAQY